LIFSSLSGKDWQPFRRRCRTIILDEPDIGIVKPNNNVHRIKDALRSPFSKFLLDYYTAAPKPVQSYFVDHPEKMQNRFTANS